MQNLCTASAAAGLRVRLPGALGISDPRETCRQAPCSVNVGQRRMIHPVRCLSSTKVPGPYQTSINDKIIKAFNPSVFVIENDSHKHAGHFGNPEGKQETHFSLQIVSEAFEGLPTLKRHRMVYGVLAEELDPQRVHSVVLKTTKTPKEMEMGPAPKRKTSPKQ